MTVSRSELREKIMTILYQVEMYKKSKYEYKIEDVIKENSEIKNTFIDDMVYGVLDKQNELDELANKYLNNWTIDRIESIGHLAN